MAVAVVEEDAKEHKTAFFLPVMEEMERKVSSL
jgi:hypothetical protein